MKSNFININMMVSKNIIGEKILMKNGLYATCIACRGCHDIDVQFEDGTIVEHRTKQNFFRGSVRHPSLSRCYSKTVRASCKDVTIMQNCGMNATCIKYRNVRDIDVQFEDGTILKHRAKRDFLIGTILNPKLKVKRKTLIEKASCLNQEVLMNNGMKAKCIAYRGWRDVDVQFEDGTIVQHRKKSDFLNGRIQSPSWWEKSFPQRVVYECLAKFFPKAVFNYRPNFLKNKDTGLNLEIDIWIPELSSAIEYDGFPWHSKESYYSKTKYELILNSKEIKNIYTLIEKGCIEHTSPKHININLCASQISSHYDILEKAINKLLLLLDIQEKISLNDDALNSIREKCNNQNLGITIMQNCGMNATCIAYREHNDIDVQFEDGTVVKHRCKSNLLKGLIKNPNLFHQAQIDSILNKTYRMNNQMLATCIAYRTCADIDVQFEDGVIVEHVQKQHFIRGNVKHPNINKHSIEASCVGLTLKMKNGMNATCITYRNGLHIDVQFEDGTVVFNKRKGNFIRGEIENPNFDRYSCLGKTIKQSCGLNATCIAYRGCDDIDVQFEDGFISKNKTKVCFLRGNIRNPNHSTRALKSSCLGLTKKMNNGMMATCIAYRSSSDIDIKFEDGLIVSHRRKERFLKGTIAHKVFH